MLATLIIIFLISLAIGCGVGSFVERKNNWRASFTLGCVSFLALLGFVVGESILHDANHNKDYEIVTTVMKDGTTKTDTIHYHKIFRK